MIGRIAAIACSPTHLQFREFSGRIKIIPPACGRNMQVKYAARESNPQPAVVRHVISPLA